MGQISKAKIIANKDTGQIGHGLKASQSIFFKNATS